MLFAREYNFQPPQISSEVMFEKLSKTGMFEKKVSEVRAIFLLAFISYDAYFSSF